MTLSRKSAEARHGSARFAQSHSFPSLFVLRAREATNQGNRATVRTVRMSPHGPERHGGRTRSDLRFSLIWPVNHRGNLRGISVELTRGSTP
jgi:hypothetical protein